MAVYACCFHLASMSVRHFIPGIYKLNRLISVKDIPVKLSRHICTTKAVSLKEIVRTEEEGVTYIEGVSVESGGNKSLVVDDNGQAKNGCPLCRLDLNIQHTDVLILNQFLDSQGQVIPKHVTGLCKRQHERVVRYITEAQKAGLLQKPTVAPQRVSLPKYVLSEKKFKQYFVDNYRLPFR